MTRFLAALMLLLLPGHVAAQDQSPDTILVLDASGSMWGQIDGVNKIVIAREVIAEVLGDLPAEMELGLMAYGHNRRGDCTDIEMLIEPGSGTSGAIIEAVNGINPRGRTPMSDAVVAAAQALRHTENPATVILVSDGIETCDADPCAVAAQLEEAGIGFTAHVIGFDVAEEPEARAQMQCLADNTGGAFLTADTAEELAAALTLVAAAPPPPPPANVTVIARVEDGSAPVSPLSWTLFDPNGGALLGPVAAPGFVVELPAGDYVVDVLRESQGTNHGSAFTVAAGESREVVITLPALLTPVSFEARLDSTDGPLITDPVLWSVHEISDTAGNPFDTGLPAGSYTVEAYWTVAEQVQQTQIAILGSDPRTVVVVFDTPLPRATLVAPDTAVAGSTLEVAWTGPDAQGDFIAAGHPGEGTYATQVQVARGNPAQLRVPSQAGTYELRYVLADGREVLAAQPLVVTPATATLIAPDTAEAGATIEVAWQGPGYAPDYISVGETDDDNSRINITLVREGSPLALLMPAEPGSYLLRYVMQQDREIIATRPIEVTQVLATLIAPETAIAGDDVEVSWDGPDYQNDYIAVSRTDDERGYENYTYTRDGTPLDLRMPTEPGTYEIRYIASQDRTVLARRSIEVTAVAASLIAPDTATAGATVEIAWDGPDYQSDFISVARVDDDRGYVNYTYTREGTPLDLVMPTEPGSYEIRYVLSQDRQTLVSRPIEVTEVGASLTAPDGALAGATVEVTWTGPDYPNDFISVARVDDDRGYVNYTYTRDGSPLDLVMPTEPGTYEIRYVLSQGRTSIAAREITVDPVAASLSAPGDAVVGQDLEVGWTGPDYANDFIVIAEPDDERGYETYSYTREGSPLSVLVPSEPGTYELRYVLNQDRTTIAAQPLIVADLPSVIFDAPPVVAAGTEFQLRHDGPQYRNDFIAFGTPGDDNYSTYTRADRDGPLTIRAPDTPGTYELRYYMAQDRRIIGRVPITVE